MSQSNSEDSVKRQLDAYNGKDIETFDDHGWSNIVVSWMNRNDDDHGWSNIVVSWMNRNDDDHGLIDCN
jgi:hypothetical protein